ncbi:GTP pyrophosphokinase [Bacillus sp. FJAT-44742]|uniref:GTP pyrophosphokinase n=1 Tax=Bacillus sp. FJAT-44742 TaxID=2014005 RepID=UPI000C23B16A|nr:GTP pyrophosphokinase family protein [Bacillus sp. FJAT-44742]
MSNWEVFLSPYKQAVEELKVKLKGLREQYQRSSQHTPIEFVTARVKPITSILDKAKRKNMSLDRLEEMQDIAGVRIVCQFVTDIDTIVALVHARKDFKVIEERDYIKEKKESGYRSYHMVVNYPVHTIEGQKDVMVEIQVRTMAMNFWATIEHSLNYKYSGEIPEDIKRRLQRAAEAAFQLDEEMSKIQGEVREAQQILSQQRGST